MSSRIALAGLLAMIAIAGCGDDGEPTSPATDEPAAAAEPEPAEPITTAMAEMNEVVAEGDCERYAELAHDQIRASVGASPGRAECDEIERQLEQVRGVEFTESEELGTGAVIQGDASEEPDEVISMAWVLDSGEWAHEQSFFGGEGQVGTEPAGDPLAVAETFVQAVRNRDCDEMEPILHPDGSLGFAAGGDLEEACRLVLDGRVFAPALEATPEAELADFGGTQDHAFVGVPTEEGYFTIVLATARPGDDGEQADEMLVTAVRSNEFDPQEFAEEE